MRFFMRTLLFMVAALLVLSPLTAQAVTQLRVTNQAQFEARVELYDRQYARTSGHWQLAPGASRLIQDVPGDVVRFYWYQGSTRLCGISRAIPRAAIVTAYYDKATAKCRIEVQ